ncbi:MAG: acyltransferase, partial [Acidimicrobiia bacterium]
MNGRRWPALDGLRGVAILLVFAFHLPFKTFLAGSYGVVLFFVISGFLITTILLREVDANGRVDFGGFYARRAQRLLPALGLVIVGHLILQITVLGQPDQWWGRTWPVLAYVANYAAMAGNNLVHMSHTWSLAIEEHFYLVWPAILVAIPARWRWRTTATLALGFLAWRLGLLWAGASDLRVYFGTDANAYAPLIGCALAVAHHEGRLRMAGKNVTALATACLL